MKFSRLSFAVVGAAICGSVMAALPQYSIKPLDAAPDQTDVYATGINNLGQIVGHSVDSNGVSHAALWNAVTGVHTGLSVITAANPDSEAYRINDAGQVVGLARNAANVRQAALWNANLNSGQILGALNGTGFSFANDVNDAGIVVGSSTAAHGQHAFTWTQGGGFVDNGSTNPNSNSAFAGWNAVNNSGKTAGTAYILFSPFKASMGTITSTQPTVISPPAQFSTGMALAINNVGTIVGYQNPNSGSPHPAIFNEDGTWQDLGTLGLGEGWAEDINETGLIVGRAFGDDGTGNFVQKAAVYDGVQMVELAGLLDSSGTGWSVLFQASGVNDLGQIVGAGIYNGQLVGYVASPVVPEPTTIGLCTAVVGAALLRRRRVM